MRFPCSVPVSLTSHGRGSFSSRPWEDATTAVERSRHGRGELVRSVL